MTKLAALWGIDIGPGHYGGGPGLQFTVRPRQFDDLLVGADRWADREFLVQGERRIGHGEFHAAIPAAAAALAADGVRAGDRVLLLSYNCPEFALALWGLWWLGAVPVFGNRWWQTAELEHAVALARPVLALTDRPDWIPPGLKVRQLSELAGLFGATADPGCRPGDEEDAALVLFTSGSAGLPKGVVLPRRSVIANQHNTMARTRRLPADLDPSRPQSVTMVCTPLFHIGGVTNILLALLTGAKLVFNEGRFDPAQVLELIESERVQTFAGVPTMAARLIDHPDFAGRDLSSLRALPMGGAPIPPRLLDTITERLPQLKRGGLGNNWGMTESGGFLTSAGAADLVERPGTAGLPAPCTQVRIADPDADGIGEVVVRTPTMMLGYLTPDGLADDGTIDADGWLHSGDLGRIDADGYLFLTGRAKDIVIRGGENIACAHVEATLLTHPVVTEVAVFGIEHADLGEELVAVVRHTGAAPTPEELREFARASLAYFEVPSRWRITTEPLPTLAGEKIDKKTLRATFAEEPRPEEPLCN
jgi:acyl-CoA synthetase (AMP-forming)/AMP-acid ligase II